jgi:nucleoid-associated protein YgaU
MPDMRKDLRYGLGIGALALIFVITFMVVRNHSQNTENDPDLASAEAAVALADPAGAPPEANPSPTLLAEGAGPNSMVVLPPIPPGPTSMTPTPGAARTPARTDPFDPRPAGPARPPVTQDWENILSNGRIPGSTPRSAAPARPATPTSPPGGAVAMTPDAIVPPPTRTPPTPRAAESIVSPRPMPAVGGGSLAAVTGRPYTIREGDTFVSIAKAAYGQSKYFLQIEKANPSVDSTRLRPGQVIILPDLTPEARAARPVNRNGLADDDNRPINPKSEYRVETGDSLYRISVRLYGTHRMADAIYEANRQAIGPRPERLRFGMILKLPQSLADGK